MKSREVKRFVGLRVEVQILPLPYTHQFVTLERPHATSYTSLHSDKHLCHRGKKEWDNEVLWGLIIMDFDFAIENKAQVTK